MEKSFEYIFKKINVIAKKINTKIVFMGGFAVSFFSQPRATYDIDGIVSLNKTEVEYFLNAFTKAGFKVDKKNPIRFIAGLPFVTFYYPACKMYVDFFLAQNKFQQEVIRRAKKIQLGKMALFIVSAEDLILLKLGVQREKDLEDVRNIILANKSKLNFAYLQKWAKILKVNMFLKDKMKSLELVN